MVMSEIRSIFRFPILLFQFCKTGLYQGGVTPEVSVLPSAVMIQNEVKSQAYKNKVKGQAVLVKALQVNSQSAIQIPQLILT